MTAGSDDLQFAAELRLVLGRLTRKLRVRTASGLTPSQSSIIATLAAAGPLHLGELACREPSPHPAPLGPSIGSSNSTWSNGRRIPTTHADRPSR